MMTRRQVATRGLYLAIGLLLGLAMAAPRVNATSVATTCTPARSATGTTILHAIGHTVVTKLGEHLWKLTITRAAITSSVHGNLGTYHAKGKYVLVFMTAHNMSKKPAVLYFDENFSLLDSQGRQFSKGDAFANGAAEDQYGRDQSDTTVQPTFSINTVFLFDVAVDAHGFKLQNSDIFGENATTLANLGV